MKLSEKKLQELKDEKISIEDLNDKYFYTKKDEVNVESILKLLNENICSFKEIVDKFKSIQDEYDELANLSRNTILLKHIVDKGITSFNGLADKFKSFKGLHTLLKNTSLLKYIIDKNICSFQELVDTFKSIKYRCNDPCLYDLISNKEFFDELIKNNKLNKEDLRYLLNTIDNEYELRNLNENTTLLKYIIDNVSFKELVDNFKNSNKLKLLLENKELFEELIQNNRLNKDDLKYLLNKIDRDFGLYELCDNTPLIKHILNEFVLNRELVDRLIRIFEYIEYCNKNNEEILKLNELNKYVYNFDEDQKLELIDLIQNNEIAKNRLKEIIDNHVESNYDFESLMSYLKKKEKMNVLNI